jgi:hypothetical protein
MRDRSLLQAVAAEFVGVMLFQLLAGSVNDRPLECAFTFAAISEWIPAALSPCSRACAVPC